MGLEGIPLWLIGLIIGASGSPGVIMIIWYVDHRKIERIRREDQKDMHRMREEDKASMNSVLAQYKEDMHTISHFYESNVDLVKKYQKLADDLAEIIHLNTQVQTQLVEQIKNNMFCPVVREKGPTS